MHARIICLLTLFALVIAANAQNRHRAATPQTKQEKMEAHALASINTLYEVKDFIKYHKKSEPLVMLDGDPDTIWNYYQVKVGISNYDMMRTSFHFFVAPKTFKIYIWDILDDSGVVPIHLISLQRWRRWRADPRFNGFHTFKNNKIIVLNRYGTVAKRGEATN
ncbi:hypothetical protein [Mucilaginibacter sp. L196]|uniref:hypothetical protein n=1 Tax=Mucilaginibacter sp. L196 TaxID=1641870 RepID=UPI00131B5743|nr:hypothetical protein [Mucilaginibacter sp. L196]